MRRDRVTGTCRAVAKLWRNRQTPLFTNSHASNTFFPPLDDLARPNCEVERLASGFRSVKYRIVSQTPLIMNGHTLPDFGNIAAAFLHYFNFQFISHHQSSYDGKSQHRQAHTPFFNLIISIKRT